MFKVEMAACGAVQEVRADHRVTAGPVSSWFGRVADGFAAWAERRRQYRELSELDDRLLEDIGLAPMPGEHGYSPSVLLRGRWQRVN